MMISVEYTDGRRKSIEVQENKHPVDFGVSTIDAEDILRVVQTSTHSRTNIILDTENIIVNHNIEFVVDKIKTALEAK
jgi:hypothetical protein